MKQEKNPIWSFLASVKLALFNLITLAITSIIGTIIPQHEPMSLYIKNFGPTTAKVFEILNIPDMYHSWWFVSLLVLFALNLIVCSIERIPRVWGVMTQDNLETDIDRLEKMRNKESFRTKLEPTSTYDAIRGLLKTKGWKYKEAEKEGGVLFFMQKGAWSRFGVYTVHVSILVIFVGAIIGAVWGYKANIMLPEGVTADQVFQNNQAHTPIPLGFNIRCDKFTLSYYGNGMPKEFRSELAVLEGGQEVLRKSIIVNDPLDYAGLTFYQSSYQAMDGQFFVEITKQDTGDSQRFLVQPSSEQKWDKAGVAFGIVNLSGPDWKKDFRYKIWFNDGKGDAQTFWVNEATPMTVKGGAGSYLFYVKKRYATGLQVAKDPGVWWVYAGCTLMLIGLYIAFFLSHRRLWIFVDGDKGKGVTRILLSGLSNKNKLGFDKDFQKFSDFLRQDDKLNIIKE